MKLRVKKLKKTKFAYRLENSFKIKIKNTYFNQRFLNKNKEIILLNT